jgi:hypothetical protein
MKRVQKTEMRTYTPGVSRTAGLALIQNPLLGIGDLDFGFGYLNFGIARVALLFEILYFCVERQNIGMIHLDWGIANLNCG